MAIQTKYISENIFSIVGDYTDIFVANRKLKLTIDNDYIYSTVYSSTVLNIGGTEYITIIIINEANLISTISEVAYGIVSSNTEGSLPDHTHTSIYGDGGEIIYVSSKDLTTVSGALQDQIDNIDTMVVHNNDYHTDNYATTTELGDVSDAIITAHDELTGLNSDDHIQYHTDARGDIRYYKQEEVDTISGSLHTEIDAIPLASGTSTGQMTFWDGADWTPTETSELFWDDTNKRTGFGTATPDSQVHIQGLNGYDGVLHLSTSADTDGGFYITGASDNIGVFSGGTYYDRVADSWRAVSTEAAGSAMKDGGITFRMNTGLTVGDTHEFTDRVRFCLDTNGNTKVGVGLGQNVDPIYALHIKAQTGNGFLTFYTQDTSAIAGIALGDRIKQYQGQIQYDNSDDKMKFKAYNTEILVLDGINQRVGIGTASPNSTTQIEGSLALSYIAKTANYTLTASDHTVNCTANSFTITLPTAVGITGRIYNIKNTGTGTITVDGNGTETIDGELNVVLTNMENLTIQSTGSNWIVL